MNARHWIGGGNVAGILGVSPYKTPLDEYLTITGQAEAPTAERASFFRRRKSFEPVAAELFAERTGLPLVRVNERYTDKEYPFIRAEIDVETTDANVEIKTCHPLAAKDWGREGADDCPIYVTAQAQHGLMVTARELCYVLAMIGFDDVRVYRVERDDELIAAIREREVAFWREHVEPELPPPPANADDVVRLFTRDSGRAIEAADEETLVTVNRIRQLKVELKERSEEFDVLQERLKLLMQDASSITVEGKPVITWKAQAARRLDQAALAEAHPALVQQFYKSTTTRVFRIR